MPTPRELLEEQAERLNSLVVPAQVMVELSALVQDALRTRGRIDEEEVGRILARCGIRQAHKGLVRSWAQSLVRQFNALTGGLQ